MKKNRSSSGGITGGSSLLVIFAVLCIAVFAILSLSGSLASSRMADASIISVEGYYNADLQAEEILSKLRSGELPQGVEKKETLIATVALYLILQPLRFRLCLMETIMKSKNGSRFTLQIGRLNRNLKFGKERDLDLWPI